MRVSCPGILAPAGPLPLHLDVIKGTDAFVNCGGSSRKTIKRLGRIKQDRDVAFKVEKCREVSYRGRSGNPAGDPASVAI